MAKFFRKFLKNPDLKEQDEIIETVNNIWYKYDIDRNGTLDKRETFRFINDFLGTRGSPPATLSQFNRFFEETDINGDNSISKNEMAKFVKMFLREDKEKHIEELVMKIF